MDHKFSINHFIFKKSLDLERRMPDLQNTKRLHHCSYENNRVMDKNVRVFNFSTRGNFLGNHLKESITSEILDVSFPNKIFSEEYSLGNNYCQLWRHITNQIPEISPKICECSKLHILWVFCVITFCGP